ncbi:MAG: hypothetical protein MK008_15135 [Bdellovibrionales bacterium]|nr:hypothetical protein [Bdellovibrionales bacterium]
MKKTILIYTIFSILFAGILSNASVVNIATSLHLNVQHNHEHKHIESSAEQNVSYSESNGFLKRTHQHANSSDNTNEEEHQHEHTYVSSINFLAYHKDTPNIFIDFIENRTKLKSPIKNLISDPHFKSLFRPPIS